MKRCFKILLLSWLAFLNIKNANASHMMGGEISYQCLGNGMFRIKFTIYQDCIGGITDVILQDDPLRYAIYRNSTVPVLVNWGAINSAGTRIVPPEFSNECISNYPNTCLREQIFFVDVDLGLSSPDGFTIVYQRCCRNFSLNNIVSPGTKGVTYFTRIPPYSSGECPNNSPVFDNVPPQIICANNPFTYDFSATDIDGDSLVYRLSPSYLGASSTDPLPEGAAIAPPPYEQAPYTIGLNYDNPIPGFPPLSIDPHTGIMVFEPTATGRYQVNVSVDEYREGVLINTHSRDLQFVITDCSKNVVANTPLFSDEPNTYIINCTDFTVNFRNSSTGGFTYEWDFGDGSPTSTSFEPTHTYADTGTYYVTLRVNMGTTCPDTIRRIVKIYPFFDADFTHDGLACPGDTIHFFDTVTSSFNNPYTLVWDFGDGDSASGRRPSHYFDEGGSYDVSMIARSTFGCKEVVTKTISIRDFQPNAGNDTIIVLGYDYNLNASGGDSYEWMPADYLSDPFIANPKATFPDTGYYTYYVNIATEEGCEAIDTINILVVKDPSILMPNAFSPNGDGLNDEFKPAIVGYPYINYFRVYNRWGELMHGVYTHHYGWDGTYKGKPVDAGVYYYVLSVRSVTGENVIQRGDVTLIR